MNKDSARNSVASLRKTARFCVATACAGFLGLTDGFKTLQRQPLGIDFWAGNTAAIAFAAAGLLALLVQARRLWTLIDWIETEKQNGDPLYQAMREHTPTEAPIGAWIILCSPIWIFTSLGLLSSKIDAAILIMYFALYLPFILIVFWLAYYSGRPRSNSGYKISLVLLIGTIVFRSFYLML